MRKLNSPEAIRKFKSTLFDTIGVKVTVAHEPLYKICRKSGGSLQFAGRAFRVKSRFHGQFATIWSSFNRQALFIEASIPKFLTGQNLIGLGDLKRGAIELIDEVLERAGIEPTEDEVARYRAGRFTLTRVDFANHLSCGSHEKACVFMRALRKRAAAKAWEVWGYRDESVYWGMFSKRRTLKAYVKWLEMLNKPPAQSVRGREILLERSKGLVRFELTYRGEELTRLGLRKPDSWNLDLACAELTKHMEKLMPIRGEIIDMERICELDRSTRARLEAFIRGVPNPWLEFEGAKPKDKREILRVTGIDIDSVLSLKMQRRCQLTFQRIFEAGWGFRVRDRNWEKMKLGRHAE